MGKLLKLIKGGKKSTPPVDDFDRAYKVIQKAKEENKLECAGLIFRIKTEDPESKSVVHYAYSGDTVVLLGLLKFTTDQIAAETSDELTFICNNELLEDEEY